MRQYLLSSFAAIILALNLAPAFVSAQSVKITPLGSHDGEFCSADRAFLFEDPSGVRILYDAGATIAGGADPRLGEVHVVLLSHGHNDHIGGSKIPEMNSGACDRPKTVSAAPNSNTAEIAAAKNSAVVVIPPMDEFLVKKIQGIRGKEVVACAETGLARETTVPLSRALPGKHAHWRKKNFQILRCCPRRADIHGQGRPQQLTWCVTCSRIPQRLAWPLIPCPFTSVMR